VREATGLDGLSAGIQFCLTFIPLVNLAYYGYLQSKMNQPIGGHARRSVAVANPV
jgi:hypothetical protein